ncbi:septation protein SepH [Glaciihabitans sp. UYNi722]|uniref:septation protein SepH n=1 Tax=Glaciihabitans sp. UYNi722 TaxID=3156344 RepID=UPI003397AE50
MQDLRVIGVENGALLVASDEGTRFRVAIDEVLQSKLRQAIPDPGAGRKLAPKEIQAHIRSGMSAQDVASITGVPLDYIQKFEGPVLAEREFVVTSALNVPVHTAMESDPLGGGSTFGTVIRERLYDLGAINERWASWKEVGGEWIVKLAFTAEQIDHDARWRFEPKKAALAPLNSEAITLSQQGEMAGALVPRLRAVGDEERHPDQSRFDSGAFTENELAEGAVQPAVYGRLDDAPAAVADAAINRAPAAEEPESNQTADLLEALRRRRGERESANFAEEEESRAAHPSTGSIRLVDIPLEDFRDDEDGALSNTAPQPNVFHHRSSKKARASMPSWDEIVFGARSDDDL